MKEFKKKKVSTKFSKFKRGFQNWKNSKIQTIIKKIILKKFKNSNQIPKNKEKTRSSKIQNFSEILFHILSSPNKITGELFPSFCNHSFIHRRMTLPKIFQFIHQHAWTCWDKPTHFWPKHKRTNYSHGQLVLLEVTTKNVFNQNFMPNESDTSCEGYGYPRNLRRNMSFCIPHLHTPNFWISTSKGMVCLDRVVSRIASKVILSKIRVKLLETSLPCQNHCHRNIRSCWTLISQQDPTKGYYRSPNEGSWLESPIRLPHGRPRPQYQQLLGFQA